MNKNLTFEVVEIISNAADQIKEKGASATPFERGVMFGYMDALRILQSTYSDFDLHEIGLDFDIEQRYLVI